MSLKTLSANGMWVGAGSSGLTISGVTSASAYQGGIFNIPTFEVEGAVTAPITLTSSQPDYLLPQLIANSSGNFIVWISNMVPLTGTNNYANVSIVDGANNSASLSTQLIVNPVTLSYPAALILSDSGIASMGINSYASSTVTSINTLTSPIVGSNSCVLSIQSAESKSSTVTSGQTGIYVSAGPILSGSEVPPAYSANGSPFSSLQYSDANFDHGFILPCAAVVYNIDSGVAYNNWYESTTVIYSMSSSTTPPACDASHQSIMFYNKTAVANSLNLLTTTNTISWSLVLPPANVASNCQYVICACEGLYFANASGNGTTLISTSNASIVPLSSYLNAQGWDIVSAHVNLMSVTYNLPAEFANTQIAASEFVALSPPLSNAGLTITPSIVAAWGNSAGVSTLTANCPLAPNIFTVALVPSS